MKKVRNLIYYIDTYINYKSQIYCKKITYHLSDFSNNF